MRTRIHPPIAAVAATASLFAAAALTGCGGAGHTGHSPVRQQAANTFLKSYLQPDGRVARPDQGNDTVSEGQAYAMLLAEVSGQPGLVRRIWTWTHTHLQQRDGLFAYHADAAGHVLDSQPASDADVLIAWALLRYAGPGAGALHAAGRQVASAVLAHEVTTGSGGQPVLAAGPWATGRPASLNPSYWSLPALAGLASLTGNPQWHRLAGSAVSMTSHLTQHGRLLPPDWAAMSAGGALKPEPAPGGGQPQTQYGLDAQRTVTWFAASCDAQARQLASRWWRLLQPARRAQAIALRPDGAVLDGAAAPLPLVASASAAHAAGDRGASHALLRRASQQQHTDPTYYGAAWSALGTALVSHPVLGGC